MTTATKAKKRRPGRPAEYQKNCMMPTVRFPRRLYRNLKREAAANLRSLNSEVVSRLQRSLEAAD